MKKRQFTIRPVNKIFIIGLSVMLILFAGIACYYAISYQTKGLLAHCDNTLDELYEAYYRKVYTFSDIYEPIFRQDPDQSVMRSYFRRTGSQVLDLAQHSELTALLGLMMAQDNDIDWIALYAPEAERNYFLARGNKQLGLLPASFPYIPLAENGKQYLLGAKHWKDTKGTEHFSYCISGGAIPASMAGSIFIGYSPDSLGRVLRRADTDDSVKFLVFAGNEVVYDSSGTYYGTHLSFDWIQRDVYVQRDPDGMHWYSGLIQNEGRTFTCLYLSPWSDVFVRANADTPKLLGLLVAFAVMALGLYLMSSRRIFHRVSEIRKGLAEIGLNKLDHRLSVGVRGDEFDEISQSINTMTYLLQTAVENEYAMRLKHMHLQLTQIQARFNPHFLYNTLEMIRGRLFKSGDLESADYIEKLARIFRNLTDARAVVKLRDELSFCSLYVALLQLRTNGDVNVSYDVAPEVLSCGIIANLIQPAIENYFVHALDDHTDGNELEIVCQPLDEKDMQIIIADNGMGSTQMRIDEINLQLSTPSLSAPSYGLMSIAKRIKLFYGDKYGLRLEKNEGSGLRVIITIPRMSMEDHEEKLLPTK